VKALLAKDGTTLIERVDPQVSLLGRMKGLLGRPSLGPGRAMFLSPCGSVHTFFMKFNLDLVFLDRSFAVRRIVRNVPPNRVVFGGWGAKSVLEIEAGWLKEQAVIPGDRIEMT
jgi:uncharacterized membrane protein (UPF0127 family)